MCIRVSSSTVPVPDRRQPAPLIGAGQTETDQGAGVEGVGGEPLADGYDASSPDGYDGHGKGRIQLEYLQVSSDIHSEEVRQPPQVESGYGYDLRLRSTVTVTIYGYDYDPIDQESLL